MIEADSVEGTRLARVDGIVMGTYRSSGKIVKLVLRGYSTKSISQSLGISPGTVKVHRENIYGKLGVSTQAELFNMFIASVSATPVGREPESARAE